MDIYTLLSRLPALSISLRSQAVAPSSIPPSLPSAAPPTQFPFQTHQPGYPTVSGELAKAITNGNEVSVSKNEKKWEDLEGRGSYRIPRYSLPPRRTFGISQVAGSPGGFDVVTKPPASSRMAMPPATSHSQQPPSIHISTEPMAAYASPMAALTTKTSTSVAQPQK